MPRSRCVRLLDGVGGDKLALADDDDLLADCLHFGEDVGAQDDGVFAGEALDQLARFDDLLRVESGGRLVENQDVGIVNDGLREADALPVAFGELADQLVSARRATAQRSMTSSTRRFRSPLGILSAARRTSR